MKKDYVCQSNIPVSPPFAVVRVRFQRGQPAWSPSPPRLAPAPAPASAAPSDAASHGATPASAAISLYITFRLAARQIP